MRQRLRGRCYRVWRDEGLVYAIRIGRVWQDRTYKNFLWIGDDVQSVCEPYKTWEQLLQEGRLEMKLRKHDVLLVKELI